MKKRYVVGVTGASGVIYARRLLEILCDKASVDLVVTDIAREIGTYEGVELDGFGAVYHDNHDMGADIASGSCRHDGMVIIPCTVKDLAAIAHGLSDTLIARAADVTLKERRTCILVLREMPLSRVHLRNMLAADEAGATIMVASPGFYNRPAGIPDLVDMVVSRVLDHLGVPNTLVQRWKGFGK